MNNAKYLESKMMDANSGLLGWTVVGCGHDESCGITYFGLILAKGNKRKIAWVNSDAEGNDCGWIDTQDLADDKAA